jgi:hypothetical protein
MTGKKPSAHQRYVAAAQPRVTHVGEFVGMLAALDKLTQKEDGLPRQVSRNSVLQLPDFEPALELYDRVRELGHYLLMHSWPVERAKAIELIEKSGHHVAWNDVASQTWVMGFRVYFAHPHDDSCVEIY